MPVRLSTFIESFTVEEHIAILMADLSGYTALTEVHGAESAASLIDRYLAIVNRSLVGDSFLHQRVGDEVIVVSSSAEQLAYTASLLFQQAYEEHQFLHLHAGMHYGPVLIKDDSYFGSAINLTARITAAAEAGTVYCSQAFVEQLPSGHPFYLEAKGPQQFKNVGAPVEIFQLTCCSKDTFDGLHIDPVCRMLLLPGKASERLEHEGRQYYFCSADCRKAFEQRLKASSLPDH